MNCFKKAWRFLTAMPLMLFPVCEAEENIFKYKVRPVANPGATITVTSSGGGQATKNVTQK
jgi:hypothetical protein